MHKDVMDTEANMNDHQTEDLGKRNVLSVHFSAHLLCMM